MRGIIFLLAVFSACSAWADGFTVKCGGYTMVANQGELSTINGERVTSQKITELGTNGLKVDMGLMPAKTVTTTALNTFVALVPKRDS